jgi:hypothetical protein
VPSLVETVEQEFIRPLLLGESIVPFRVVSPAECVVPWLEDHLLSVYDEDLDLYPGLADWWRKADAAWLAHRSSEKFELNARYDFQSRLSRQLRTAAPKRVVYTKSGSILAACRVSDPHAVIDQKLYWAAVTDEREAHYLCGIFNSRTMTKAVAPFQSRGQFGTRDFDKYVFQLPIPLFDPAGALHAEIATLAARAEALVATLEIPQTLDFKTQRKRVRESLAEDGVLDLLDSDVAALLGDAQHV